MDTYPAPARPELAHALGIRTTTFEQWALGAPASVRAG
jgi:hypothetical protein